MPFSKQKTQKKHTHKRFLLLLAFGVCLMIASFVKPGASLAFDSEPIRDFSEGWELLSDDGAPAQPLPAFPLKLPANGKIRVKKAIPDTISYPAVICFRTAHQKVRLYCGDEQLYSFGYDNFSMMSKSPGSAWNFVRLPRDLTGKYLVIELESPYPSYQGRLESVQVGSKAALVFWLLRNYTFSFVVTLIIFVVAATTLTVYFLLIRRDATVGRETYYLGLFALFVSLWLFGEGRLTQFFFIPPAVNTNAVFLSMLATPIPLIEYIACGRSKEACKLLTAVSRILSVVFVVCVSLQLFGIADFIEQIVFIHACLILACLAMLYAVVFDLKRQPNAALYRLMISLSVLAICFVAETAGIYYGANSVGNMMRIGVLVFIAVQAQEAFQRALRMIRLSRLASIDGLTECYNRTAYTQRMDELQGQHNVGVVIADINDLKKINDTYGHDVGDDAIVRCAKCFSEAFQVGGACFRIGGDEFAMLGRNLSLERLQSMGETFEMLLRQQGEQTQYPFAASFGYAVYDADCDGALSDTTARADKKMYQNKRTAKQELEVL